MRCESLDPLRLDFAYNLRNRPVTVTRTGDGTQISRYLYNALEQLVSRTTRHGWTGAAWGAMSRRCW